MGYRIPPATHADWPALSVLGQILGGGESSRLYQAVVKDKELCTGTGAGSGARMGPALFSVSCSVRTGKDITEAEAAMNAVLDAAPTVPVTEQELQRVRASSRRTDVGTRESALSRAVSLADNAVLYNDPNRINTLSARLTSVTAADIQRVARTYLRPTNRIVMHTLPGAGAPPVPPSTQKR
jgi:zinc protease